MRNADRGPSPTFTRREVLTLGIGAFVVASIPLAGRGRPELVRRAMPVMGTIAELAVVHRDPRLAHAAMDAAMEELQTVEQLMTRFSEASDVGRANRLAATGPVSVSLRTAAVLREALAWAEASAGDFDPCIGRAIRLWDVGQRRTPPPEDQVRPLAGRSLYRAMELETWRGGPVIRFRDPGVEVDLGGIAKGHGVDAAVQALRRRGITRAIVNVGGDLFALGESESGEPWRVGVRSPDDPSRLAGELAVSDGALATSGDYLQFFSHGGRRYHHLLDPTTAAPRRTAMHSVTVSASTCLAADAAATAVYGMAPERAEGLLRARAPGARIVSTVAREV
ncbi:MAG: FAD:protein FMN transferase [Candidatus Rokubacteria bacterium]|nr:FAD:protein FMN transferase [Candidatus Rokubacteria bacterium]